MYRDSSGYLHRGRVHNSENAIEFTVIEFFLDVNARQIDHVVIDYLTQADRNKEHTKHKLSHDNLTACYAYFSYRYDVDEIEDQPLDATGKRMFLLLISARKKLASKHPREWSFYNICEGRFNIIDKVLISLIMRFSCFRKYKYSIHGDGSKGNERRLVKMIGTDTKILAWLRLCVMSDFKKTTAYCNKKIKKYFGNWRMVFFTYFNEHPLAHYKDEDYEL